MSNISTHHMHLESQNNDGVGDNMNRIIQDMLLIDGHTQ